MENEFYIYFLNYLYLCFSLLVILGMIVLGYRVANKYSEYSICQYEVWRIEDEKKYSKMHSDINYRGAMEKIKNKIIEERNARIEQKSKRNLRKDNDTLEKLRKASSKLGQSFRYLSRYTYRLYTKIKKQWQR